MSEAYEVIRTGSEHFTIIEAHPYHHRVTTTNNLRCIGSLETHKGSGIYRKAYDPQCPRCCEELKAFGEIKHGRGGSETLP